MFKKTLGKSGVKAVKKTKTRSKPLPNILISNFNLASTIEPGNQFSEININGKSFEWRLGSNPNNWHTHRKEVNFFNSDQDSSQIYRLYDIEQTI